MGKYVKKETEDRMVALRVMHKIMSNMNDEDCYDEWIKEMPDEPSEDDFESIASNDESYVSVEKEFFRLCKVYLKYGLSI